MRAPVPFAVLGACRIATCGKLLRMWPTRRRAELRLCVRVTISAVLSLAAAHLLKLPVALWAVLTAVLLTQVSVGRSLRATSDYLASTLGAAIYAGAVGTLFPDASELSHLAALAVAVAPPALLAAINARFNAAPFTAVLVFLAPTITHAAPVTAALDRVIEVAVGGVIGLVVSLVVLPARAYDLTVESAAYTLDLFAQRLAELLAKIARRLEAPTVVAQNEIGEAIVRLETIALEAKHERITRLAAEPDHAPCCARW
jgi:uncharacterized membrane protein YgaE (UPF0421/DUF939 family)